MNNSFAYKYSTLIARFAMFLAPMQATIIVKIDVFNTFLAKHVSDKTLESLSAYPGILGTAMMSMNSWISPYAFLIWIPGNLASGALMMRDWRLKMVVVFMCHTLASLNGIYQWFFR